MVAQDSRGKNIASLKTYYRFHSTIYDLSRWAFLFGRNEIISESAKFAKPRKVLEVGCGTGKNLLTIHQRFPEAELSGIDISPQMLRIAEKKLSRTGANIKMMEKEYSSPVSDGEFDLVIFSYCLSMINPGWENALLVARKDLSPNGIIAVADFLGTKHNFFKKWMATNHVKMEYHLDVFLHEKFKTKLFNKKFAYGGLWEYFLFIGGK